MDFTGKVVLVTGGGAGIGRESAILFAKHGAKVAVNSVGPVTGQETVDMIKANGGDAIFLRGDVSSNAFCKEMVAKTVETFGRLDVLVNSAGVVRPGTVCEVSEETIDEVLGVNVKGVFFASKYAIEEMVKVGGGSIVHVASAACMYGVKNRSIYSASKGAVVALTRAMAVDHAHQHIRGQLHLSRRHSQPLHGGPFPGGGGSGGDAGAVHCQSSHRPLGRAHRNRLLRGVHCQRRGVVYHRRHHHGGRRRIALIEMRCGP